MFIKERCRYYEFFNAGLSFNPEVFILCKKCGGQREPRDGGREFWYAFGLEFWNFGIPLIREIRTFIKTFLLSNNVNCNLR